MAWQILRTVGTTQVDQSGSVFVHDFCPVDLPFGTVVGAFVNYVTDELVAQLATEAWRAEQEAADRVLSPLAEAPSTTAAPVAASLGPPRTRRDAVIVPIAWDATTDAAVDEARMSGRRVPPLEADLEIVAFGPGRTHIHLLGLSALAPTTAPCTDRASLEHRMAVATVRHVLTLLAEAILREATRGPEPDSADDDRRNVGLADQR